MDNYIPTNIKYLRDRKGLSQQEIGNLVSKDRSLISQWEAGTKEISVKDVVTLSNFFDIKMDEFVSENLKLKDEKEKNALKEKEKLEKFVLDNDIILTLPTDKILSAEEYIKIHNKANNILLNKIGDDKKH